MKNKYKLIRDVMGIIRCIFDKGKTIGSWNYNRFSSYIEK